MTKVPEWIWFTTDKHGKKRAWRFSRFQMRAFPMPLAEAELLRATEAAEVLCCHPFRECSHQWLCPCGRSNRGDFAECISCHMSKAKAAGMLHRECEGCGAEAGEACRPGCLGPPEYDETGNVPSELCETPASDYYRV